MYVECFTTCKNANCQAIQMINNKNLFFATISFLIAAEQEHPHAGDSLQVLQTAQTKHCLTVTDVFNLSVKMYFTP